MQRNVTELAEAQKIDISNLQWYGTFHDTAHHPHMHLLVYSKDAKQGWLTNNGMAELRSALGNDIFHMEQYKLALLEDGVGPQHAIARDVHREHLCSGVQQGQVRGEQGDIRPWDCHHEQ